MGPERFIVTTFCDDVRQEVGNKLSLIGCYSAELVVDSFPVTLAKLCAHVRVMTPVQNPFQELTLRAYMNDEFLGELQVPSDGMKEAASRVSSDESAARWQMFSAVMVFSPLAITERSKLRIDAVTEDGEMRGQSLILRDGQNQTPTTPEVVQESRH